MSLQLEMSAWLGVAHTKLRRLRVVSRAILLACIPLRTGHVAALLPVPPICSITAAVCSLNVLDFLPPLCFPPIHPSSTPRHRHDAARGSSRERRPTTTPCCRRRQRLACLRGWSAGRRLSAFPLGSHPGGIHRGASGRNSQSRLFLAQATARAGFASLRLPMRGLANPWRFPALHSPCGEKGKAGRRAGPGPKSKKQGGAALADTADPIEKTLPPPTRLSRRTMQTNLVTR